MNVNALTHSLDDSPMRVYRRRLYLQDKSVGLAFAAWISPLTQTKGSVQETLVDPVVMLANALLKRISTTSKLPSDEIAWFEELKQRVRAAKLGLSFATAAANPSLMKFAVKNHLHRYLFVLKHELRVDENDVVHIMRHGEWKPWPVHCLLVVI